MKNTLLLSLCFVACAATSRAQTPAPSPVQICRDHSHLSGSGPVSTWATRTYDAGFESCVAIMQADAAKADQKAATDKAAVDAAAATLQK